MTGTGTGLFFGDNQSFYGCVIVDCTGLNIGTQPHGNMITKGPLGLKWTMRIGAWQGTNVQVPCSGGNQFGVANADSVQLDVGADITSGTGAPNPSGNLTPTAGDIYFRIDTPSTQSQRIYTCTVGGATPAWAALAV